MSGTFQITQTFEVPRVPRVLFSVTRSDLLLVFCLFFWTLDSGHFLRIPVGPVFYSGPASRFCMFSLRPQMIFNSAFMQTSFTCLLLLILNSLTVVLLKCLHLVVHRSEQCASSGTELWRCSCTHEETTPHSNLKKTSPRWIISSVSLCPYVLLCYTRPPSLRP